MLVNIEVEVLRAPLVESVLDAIYFFFGGRESLSANTMESAILEWGMMACADDPVIDFKSFCDRCAQRLSANLIQSK
jgi:hypothetical protein